MSPSLGIAQEPTLPAEDTKFPEVDVLVVGGKVFSMQEVDMPAGELIKSIRSYYEGFYERLKSEMLEGEFEKASEEWNKQLRHIERFRNANVAVIPQNLYGKLCMYHANSVCEARTIHYKPNRIVSDAGRLKEWCGERFRATPRSDITWRPNPVYQKVYHFISELAVHERVVITVEQNLVDKHVLYLYSEQRGKIYTPVYRTYHTMSGSDVCVGDRFPAREWWARGDFEELMNSINCFSLGNDRARDFGVDTDLGIDVRDLIRDEYVMNIVKEELWTV